MHSFKNFISEKLEPARGIKPKAGDEAAFMAKHTVDVMDYPGGDDDKDVTNQTKKSPAKKKRLADNDQESAEKVYEANDGECPHCDMEDGEHEENCPMMKEAMDPVGQEDDDVDNDGDSDKADKYLKNRRKAINKAMKKEDEIDEMSDAQMKKREEIVKSMKDKTADFKKRYGDRWKSVMYATATKQAMKEEVEIEEAASTSFSSASKKAYEKRIKALENAKKWMKRTGLSAEKAVKEFDLFPSDVAKLKEEVDLDEGRLPKYGSSVKYSTVMKKIKDGNWEASTDVKPRSSLEIRDTESNKKTMIQVEEVEIDEAYKAGNLKLKDGSQVKLTSEDAKVINSLYKNLNASNRKQMEQRMMRDKKSFGEIVAFAKETM